MLRCFWDSSYRSTSNKIQGRGDRVCRTLEHVEQRTLAKGILPLLTDIRAIPVPIETGKAG